MFQSKIYTVLFLLFISSSLFAGGGWPQPKGQGYFKLYEWWIVSDQHFTDLGRIDPNMTTGIFNTSIYAEYGFTNRITGIINAPLYSRTFFNNQVSKTTGEVTTPGESIGSFGDTDLGIKYGLSPNKAIATSVSLILGIPLGKDSGGSQGNLQTGDGEFNQILRLDASTSIPVKAEGVSAYANVYIGFNNRTNDFSDEFRYGVEAGVSLFNQKLLLSGRLNAVESLQNGKDASEITSTSVFSNNSEYINVGGEIAYNINEKFGVSASYDSAVSGKIILASPAYSVGVFFNLR